MPSIIVCPVSWIGKPDEPKSGIKNEGNVAKSNKCWPPFVSFERSVHWRRVIPYHLRGIHRSRVVTNDGFKSVFPNVKAPRQTHRSFLGILMIKQAIFWGKKTTNADRLIASMVSLTHTTQHFLFHSLSRDSKQPSAVSQLIGSIMSIFVGYTERKRKQRWDSEVKRYRPLQQQLLTLQAVRAKRSTSGCMNVSFCSSVEIHPVGPNKFPWRDVGGR